VVAGGVVAVIATRGAVGPVLAVGLALAGWDLTRFAHRQAGGISVENAGGLNQAHGQWLAITIVAGVVLALVAQTMRVSMGLGWVVSLGLLAALALNWLVAQLAQRNNP
jgi:hypothetical protein